MRLPFAICPRRMAVIARSSYRMSLPIPLPRQLVERGGAPQHRTHGPGTIVNVNVTGCGAAVRTPAATGFAVQLRPMRAADPCFWRLLFWPWHITKPLVFGMEI